MTAEKMITTECPRGHRVRGTEEFLGQRVRCPRCREEFEFAAPTSQPAPVIAVDATSTSSADSNTGATASETEEYASDTSIMRILGDWMPPPSRPCPECGAEIPVSMMTCENCNAVLSFHESDESEALESRPVINTNQFEDVAVRSIMRPRADIAFIDLHTPLAEMQQFVRRSMHTRYPVCDGTLDAALGVVHIKDILVIPVDSKEFDLSTIMTPLERVPEKLPISGAFRHLQLTHQSIALVINPSGAALGIITMKDILARMTGGGE